ncbi:polysaccharide biosynthesis protein [Candidatus Nitrospira bockiana]
MTDMLLKCRRASVVAIHVLVVLLANYLAFSLRFDGAIPEWALEQCLLALPLVVGLRLLMFHRFMLLEGLWRYTSVWDLRNIVVSVSASTALIYAAIHWALAMARYPRSVFILDAVLTIMLLGGMRLGRRMARESAHPKHEKRRLLIYGAGDAGEMIVRDIHHNPLYGYETIGFVDDDVSKSGHRIHGVPVLGTRHQLPVILNKHWPDEILIAIPTAGSKMLREIVTALQTYRIPIKTLPSLRDLLDGRATVSQIRNLSIDDLLGRNPVSIDLTAIRCELQGRRVLVTGAGGSIGSELCRQISALGPQDLVLYERYENNLYAIHTELMDRGSSPKIHAVIGDVRDTARLNATLSAYRPEIVFHAAAHKHVPLMEFSPCEAVKNNIFGTKAVAEAAHHHYVERFVLISTDKAVNPTSVMGATKRVAELIIQDLNRSSRTRFMTVRFGNVLGSNGSVVPRFLEQIKSGGPVTVTHPEVRRYFMLIPEAVQLVLQAATLADPDDVYVLEMGEQINVVELARNVIRLSGYVPDVDIDIEFVGLRPGEKLFEELVGPDETVEPSRVDKILRVRPSQPPDRRLLDQSLTILEQAASAQNAERAVEALCRLIPTFKPLGNGAILAAERMMPSFDARAQRITPGLWSRNADARSASTLAN